VVLYFYEKPLIVIKNKLTISVLVLVPQECGFESSNLRNDGMNMMENNFIPYSSLTAINIFGLQAEFV
jgi:hypothetical protein